MEKRCERQRWNVTAVPQTSHYLLAGRGFDAERVAQTLNAIKVVQAFEPLQPLQDTDV